VYAFDSAVLTVGAFNAGSAANIIPDSAEIKGTVRTHNPKVRELIEQKIRDLSIGISEAYGATCTIDYEKGYAAVFNDEELYKLFNKIAAEVLPEVKIVKMPPMMGGEDFSAYQTIAPSFFAGVGAGPENGEYFVNHHPKFCVSEGALSICCTLYVAFALNAAKK
jgi:amidohydrolase